MKKIYIMIAACLCLYTNAEYKVSPKGEAFIKKHEGLILKVDAYNQIGYGHLNQGSISYRHIDKATANRLFIEDIQYVNGAINRLISPINVKLSQDFIDGLGSLIYNCGESGVKNSEFYSKLVNARTQKDLKNALQEVKTFRCKSFLGLKKRRLDEFALMSSYSPYYQKGLEFYLKPVKRDYLSIYNYNISSIYELSN